MNNDEELQGLAERKQLKSNSSDARAYQRVFDALEKEPWHVPYGFADKVMLRTESKKTFSADILWMCGGLFFLVTAGVVISFLLKLRFDVGSFRFVSSYGSLIVFGIVLVALFQVMDKALIHRKPSM